VDLTRLPSCPDGIDHYNPPWLVDKRCKIQQIASAIQDADIIWYNHLTQVLYDMPPDSFVTEQWISNSHN
jgi:hypothetical protein